MKKSGFSGSKLTAEAKVPKNRTMAKEATETHDPKHVGVHSHEAQAPVAEPDLDLNMDEVKMINRESAEDARFPHTTVRRSLYACLNLQASFVPGRTTV